MVFFTPSVSRSRTRMRRTRRGRRKLAFRPRRTVMTTGRVKRIIDAELKFRDLGVGPVAIPSIVGFISPISNIAQGDAVNQRNGNWIKPVTWYGTITVNGNAGAAVATSQIRLMAVCWKENEDNNPILLSEVMQDVASPHQGFNVPNKGQFSILWSRVVIVSNNTDNPQFQKMFCFYVKPPMKALYDGAELRNNNLFIIGYSDIAAAGNPPTMEFETRLRFTDS